MNNHKYKFDEEDINNFNNIFGTNGENLIAKNAHEKGAIHYFEQAYNTYNRLINEGRPPQYLAHLTETYHHFLICLHKKSFDVKSPLENNLITKIEDLDLSHYLKSLSVYISFCKAIGYSEDNLLEQNVIDNIYFTCDKQTYFRGAILKNSFELLNMSPKTKKNAQKFLDTIEFLYQNGIFSTRHQLLINDLINKFPHDNSYTKYCPDITTITTDDYIQSSPLFYQQFTLNLNKIVYQNNLDYDLSLHSMRIIFDGFCNVLKDETFISSIYPDVEISNINFRIPNNTFNYHIEMQFNNEQSKEKISELIYLCVPILVELLTDKSIVNFKDIDVGSIVKAAYLNKVLHEQLIYKNEINSNNNNLSNQPLSNKVKI